MAKQSMLFIIIMILIHITMPIKGNVLKQQVLKLGDINQDQEINILDALLAAQHAKGLKPLSFYAAAADVNGCDMAIDAGDALMIAQYSAKLIREFPCSRIVKPNQTQLAWAASEIGVLIHYDLVTYEPSYNWRQNWNYNPDPKIFNPSALDTDQWIRAAKAAGATYAVLVAKHCVGFSLWPTKAHGYSVKNSPWKGGKGDLVKDFVTSCRKYGVKPGFYYSTSANGYYKVDRGRVVTGDPAAQKAYNKMVEIQVAELWSNYGDLFEIWFDGGTIPPHKGGPDIVPLLRRYQPNAMVFQGPVELQHLVRWVGNEVGAAPYPCWATMDSTWSNNGNPNGRIWSPGEADVPLRHNHSFQGGWFWHANQDHLLRSLDLLLDIYYTSVGRNTNLLLGMVVDTRGLVPNADVNLLRKFGQEIKRRFSTSIAETRGSGQRVILNLASPQTISTIMIMEDIQHGERVRSYNVEAWVNGKWMPLCQGSSIGHKRLQKFTPTVASKVRLNISQYIAKPMIKKMAVYHH